MSKKVAFLEVTKMIPTLWHAACLLALGFACLYAGSDSGRVTHETPVRDILFPKRTDDRNAQ